MLIIILNFIVLLGLADELPSKNGNFSKGGFSNNWNKTPIKSIGRPPDPGNGNGGNPIPISSGLSFLIISSGIYFVRRLYKENIN